MPTGRDETRARLERELGRVQQAVRELKDQPPREESGASGDNTPLTEHEDTALSMERKELQARRVQQLLDRGAALDQALQRHREGRYGICEDCDGPISEERLDAVPEAAWCRICEEGRERQTGTTASAEPRMAGWEEASEMRDQENFQE